MRRLIEIFVVTVVLLLVAKCALAETKTVITPSGSYLVIQNGSTTSIIQTGKGKGPQVAPTISIPSGNHTLIDGSGSYMIRNNIIIQTGKAKGK